MPITAVNVGLSFGPISLGGTWEPDEAEVEAAWEMYIELATRISTQPLREDEGVLREALESLYQLFPTAREILRRHGPTVARKKGRGEHSFAELAVYVLNYGLRPLLAKWHPLLADHEARRSEDCSPVEHEVAWERAGELREALEQLRLSLLEYANLLAEVAGVEPLIALNDRPERRG